MLMNFPFHDGNMPAISLVTATFNWVLFDSLVRGMLKRNVSAPVFIYLYLFFFKNGKINTGFFGFLPW